MEYPIPGWGGTPSQVYVGGYPSQVWGVPWVPLNHPDLVRGVPQVPPNLRWGPPNLRPVMGYSPSQTWDGVPPSQTWDGVPPQPDLGWGTPYLDLGQDTLPPDLRWGTPLSLRWGTPYPDLRWGTPSPPRPGMGYPPPKVEQTHTCENNLPSYVRTWAVKMQTQIFHSIGTMKQEMYDT